MATQIDFAEVWTTDQLPQEEGDTLNDASIFLGALGYAKSRNLTVKRVWLAFNPETGTLERVGIEC